MATKRPDKEKLIEHLAGQREFLSNHRSELKKQLSPTLQLKSSFKKNPVAWFTGSLGISTLLTLLLRRPAGRIRKRKFGLITTAALAFAKPAIKRWLIKQGKEFLKHRLLSSEPKTKLGEPRNL